MRSQNRKVNSMRSGLDLASVGSFAGRAGCLGLLALGLALVNPVGTSAFAEEGPEDEGSVPVVQADVLSTVGISFSPAAGSASLSPTTAIGQSAQVNVLATVDVQNSGGYAVYLKSNSQNLVGKNNAENVIPGVAGNVTYNNLTTNSWGYYAGEGVSVPEGATYKAVSVSGNGDKVAENGSNKIKTDTKKIMLSFAAKINDAVPADTYQNTVTMSVVSNPLQTTLMDITSMQDMTSAICTASANYETKQLKDVRDGKFYWVAKLGDGKCWMTQNLDLDLSTGTKLTSDTSDVPAAGWTPGFNTATKAIAPAEGVEGTVNPNSQTETRSWSLGDYRLTNPPESQSCGYPLADVAACPGPNATSGLTTNRFMAYTTPTTANNDEDAHYILGNHYQWNAATAGTGGSITEGQATNSICPKGWKLPESNASVAGTFKGLIDAYNIGSDVAKLTDAPLYFVRGGVVDQDTGFLFHYAGSNGVYWSSTPLSNGLNAYPLHFWGAALIDPSASSTRNFGLSVRCIAR